MVRFIFKHGESTVDQDTALYASMLRRLHSDISKAVTGLPCPNHEFESRATILISDVLTGYDWEILNACCGEFKHAIESAVPFPWNKTQRHLMA